MTLLTVAICTYNGQDRLSKLLEELSYQSIPDNISWEILVIDNNSQDHTKQCVSDYQKKWIGKINLRYTFEPKQGLAFARQHAIEKAQGKLVGFLDDDNIPDQKWLESACEFVQKNPQAGAVGSHIIGEFEDTPIIYLEKIGCFLSIIDRGKEPFIYEPKNRLLPPGAGLVVLRQAWLECVPKTLFLKGRINGSMLASEDLEALSYIQRGGWEIWHNPNMVIKHQIPAYRLERQYLLSVVRGIGLARHYIRMIRLNPWQRPFATPIYIANDIRKAFFYYLQNRSYLEDAIDIACQMEFLWSTLLSPFYILRKQILEWFKRFLGKFKNV